MEENRTTLGEHQIPLLTLFFATLGGPVAWTLHLAVSYLLVALGCNVSWAGTDAALGVTTLLFAGAAAASGWAAHRNWRRLRGERDWMVADPQGHSPFLLMVGMCSAALFLLLILLNGLPPLFVPTCGAPELPR